jgi:hypothetical protein
MNQTREPRAGRFSRASSRELDIDDTVAASEDGTAIFNGHVPVKTDKRLLCDVCKAAQTTIRLWCSSVQPSDRQTVHDRAHGTGVAGTATCISKRKRS